MNRKSKVSRTQYYLGLSLVILMLVLFAILQTWAAIEATSKYEWHREPAFWAGAIVWGTVGYFLHELKTWLRKKAVAALVFSFSILILGHLAMTRQFPILPQFMMWGWMIAIVAGVRAIVEEDLLKKYESVHGQTTPNSSQHEKSSIP